MKRYILLLALFLNYALIYAQEKKLPTFITDSLESYITRGMEDWQIPGLSVAIVKDGEVIFLKGYGKTRIINGNPVDENTLFMIGSNTKAFTATALSMLDESTDFNLTDKVQKWMPEFQLKDPFACKEVNVVDLLSHRIGFESFQGDFTYWTSNLSRSQVIHKMGLIEAPYGFRTKWGYCNAAFLTAGELIPRIIGKSWEETIKDSILVPLKMNRTLTLSEEFKKASNIAFPHTLTGHALTEIPIPICDNLAPAASMGSSTNDLSKWLLAQLNNGKIDSVQVLPTQSIQSLRSPYSILGVDQQFDQETHFYLYGLGLMIKDRNGKLVYSHGGAVDGFLSTVMFVPEERLGIVVLTNTDQNNFYQNLADEISDSFLGLPFRNYSKKSIEQFRKDRIKADAKLDSLRSIVKQHNQSAIPLKSFVGQYENAVYGTIKIELVNDRLNIYFSNHPTLVGMLEHINNDTFLCQYSNPGMGIVEIPFKIEDKKVFGLTLRVADFLEFTPYEFTRTD